MSTKAYLLRKSEIIVRFDARRDCMEVSTKNDSTNDVLSVRKMSKVAAREVYRAYLAQGFTVVDLAAYLAQNRLSD
jgi:hypothetical protein